MNSHITDTIRYIGVDVPDKHMFENQYATPQGMAYNSYIIFGEKTALLDAVDIDATDQWIYNLQNALGDRKPDYFIAHHMEPDHSANLRRVMDMYPGMTLIASAKALAMVGQFFEDSDYSDRAITVGDGATIDLGDRQLQVYTAPFVHWPEVIVTYDTKDKVLFSADAFGKFGANQFEDPWLAEARRYYCNIVGKYGAQVQMLLKKVAKLEIKTIAPLHGPVLGVGASSPQHEDIAPCIDAYQHWSTYTPETEGVLVAYASVYGGTARAALRMAQEIEDRGVEVVRCDLCNADVSEALAQAFRLSKAVLASITYDASLFPAMYRLLHHLQTKNWQGRRVALIENGTWAPVAGRLMADILSSMKNTEIVTPTLSLRSTMHRGDEAIMRQIIDQLLAK